MAIDYRCNSITIRKELDRFPSISKNMKPLELVFTLLHDNEYEIVLDTRCREAGYVDDAELRIGINPFRGDRIITLIHECLHVIYPDATERTIINLTKQIYMDLPEVAEQALLYGIIRRIHEMDIG